jgi:hypothetical protein
MLLSIPSTQELQRVEAPGHGLHILVEILHAIFPSVRIDTSQNIRT